MQWSPNWGLLFPVKPVCLSACLLVRTLPKSGRDLFSWRWEARWVWRSSLSPSSSSSVSLMARTLKTILMKVPTIKAFLRWEMTARIAWRLTEKTKVDPCVGHCLTGDVDNARPALRLSLPGWRETGVHLHQGRGPVRRGVVRHQDWPGPLSQTVGTLQSGLSGPGGQW